MISGFLFQSFFASACCIGRYLGWGSGGLAVNMIIVFAGRRDKVLDEVFLLRERYELARLASGSGGQYLPYFSFARTLVSKAIVFASEISPD